MSRQPQRSSYGGLMFDATLIATHAATSEITEYPVEEGANPADHIRPKAQTVSLEVIFTPLPLGEDDPDERIDAPRNIGGGFARTQLEVLHSLQGQALPLVMPWWATLPNMAIQSISNPVSAGIEGFRVKVDFKQIRFVSTSTVRFEKQKKTSISQNPTAKKKQGDKAPAIEERNSILYDVVVK